MICNSPVASYPCPNVQTAVDVRLECSMYHPRTRCRMQSCHARRSTRQCCDHGHGTGRYASKKMRRSISSSSTLCMGVPFLQTTKNIIAANAYINAGDDTYYCEECEPRQCLTCTTGCDVCAVQVWLQCEYPVVDYRKCEHGLKHPSRWVCKGYEGQ